MAHHTYIGMEVTCIKTSVSQKQVFKATVDTGSPKLGEGLDA